MNTGAIDFPSGGASIAAKTVRITLGSLYMRQNHPFSPDIAEFLTELCRQEASPATARNYAADLRAFAR